MKEFIRNHKRLSVLLGIFLLVLVGGSIYLYIFSNKADNTVNDDNVVVRPTTGITTVSPLTGLPADSSVANRHTVAVMIENSPDARPQTGLTSADIVYEAVTEGGITRFMGIFSSQLPTKAGPVRSARSYFIDWLSEYDSFYAHVGGSPTALSRISQYGIKDYATSSDAYWREPKAGLAIEHTMYTNVQKIYDGAVNNKKWPADGTVSSWKFADPVTTSPVISDIKLKFSTATYGVEWQYDQLTKKYSRLLAGKAHSDKVSGDQIKATNIAVIQVTHSANGAYSDTGHEAEWTMQTTGSGKAWIYRNGEQVEGTWKKPTRTDRTRFYDSTDTEIPLNPGNTWVEVIPQDGTVTAS